MFYAVDAYDYKASCVEEEGWLKGFFWCSQDYTNTYERSYQATSAMLKAVVWPVRLARMNRQPEEEQNLSQANASTISDIRGVALGTCLILTSQYLEGMRELGSLTPEELTNTPFVRAFIDRVVEESSTENEILIQSQASDAEIAEFAGFNKAMVSSIVYSGGSIEARGERGLGLCVEKYGDSSNYKSISQSSSLH